MKVNGSYRVYKSNNDKQQRFINTNLELVGDVPMFMVYSEKDFVRDGLEIVTESYYSALLSKRYTNVTEGMYVEIENKLHQIALVAKVGNVIRLKLVDSKMTKGE